MRRAGELSARYGGEEFVLILPGSNALAAAEVAERLRDGIAELKMVHAKHPLGMATTRIGVASFDPVTMMHERTMMHGRDPIAAADAALYRAKSPGRNRVELAA